VAHSKSAQKRIRQSSAGRLRNRRRKAAVKEAIHQFDAAVAAGNTLSLIHISEPTRPY